MDGAQSFSFSNVQPGQLRLGSQKTQSYIDVAKNLRFSNVQPVQLPLGYQKTHIARQVCLCSLEGCLGCPGIHMYICTMLFFSAALEDSASLATLCHILQY